MLNLRFIVDEKLISSPRLLENCVFFVWQDYVLHYFDGGIIDDVFRPKDRAKGPMREIRDLREPQNNIFLIFNWNFPTGILPWNLLHACVKFKMKKTKSSISLWGEWVERDEELTLAFAVHDRAVWHQYHGLSRLSERNCRTDPGSRAFGLAPEKGPCSLPVKLLETVSYK